MNQENKKYEIDGIDVFFQEYCDDDHASVLIILRHQGKFVFSKNKKRNGLEFPGGHKENNETVIETAKRESFEETGTIIKNIETVGYYVLPTGHKTVITTAEVEEFNELPAGFETENVELYDEIPQEKLSFQDGLYKFLTDKLF